MSSLFNCLNKKNSNNSIHHTDPQIDVNSSEFLVNMLKRKSENSITKTKIVKKEKPKIKNISSIYYNNKSFPSNGWIFGCIVCDNATSRSKIFENKYEIHLCTKCEKKNKYQIHCNELMDEYEKSYSFI